MSDTDKNELWKIIARATCPRPTPNCKTCFIQKRCITGAKKAADNIRNVYLITPKGDRSIFASANLNNIPEAEVVELSA